MAAQRLMCADMKLITDHVERAEHFEKLADEEHDAVLESALLKQAVTGSGSPRPKEPPQHRRMMPHKNLYRERRSHSNDDRVGRLDRLAWSATAQKCSDKFPPN
jgi:hypothetical protein